MNSEKKDLYVVYNPEVEEFLGVPIAAMQREHEHRASALNTALADLRRTRVQLTSMESISGAQDARLGEWDEWFRTANLWQRIKFLFKKGKP